MNEIQKPEVENNSNSQPFTDDEIRLFNVYDVAVGLIIAIEEGKTFTLAEIKNQLIEIIEIIQEEL